LKVVILNNDFRVYWKGRLIYLRQHLASQNIQLNAIELFGKGSPYAFDSINSMHNWWACLYPDKSAADIVKQDLKKKLFSALDDINPDVVVGPSIVFFAGALGIAWAKKRKKRFIMFDDARPMQVKRNVVVQWVKNLITSQADAFWLPSNSYDSDHAQFKKRGLHFFYGLACIDNNMFRAGHGLMPKTKTIICVARLVPIKNLDGLLQAWKLVEQQGTGYKLLLVGNGPEEEKLKKLKTTLALKKVEFADAVGNDRLPAYFGSADAFVLPSFSETWGLVVNEAMAAGLPVLLSRTVNAANDLLQEGVNGFGFDAFDTGDIARVLLRYINLDEPAKELMGAASFKIIDGMSYQKMGAQLVEALAAISATKYKTTGVVAAAIIANWHGRYNTSGWDKL
jgi:glycosyltransferase involved in cell wall biosynthesis